MKLKSLASDITQRLCAKFGANRSIGGAINRDILRDIKVDRIRTKFGDRDTDSFPRQELIQIFNISFSFSRLSV